MNIAEIRAKFPMYADLSDEQLVSGIHQKFYPDIPIAEFAKRIQYTAPDPTEGMSTFDKVAAGAGKAGSDILRGIGQNLGIVDRAEIAESRKLDAPLMKTGAGLAGNIATNVAAMLPTARIPGAATIPGAAAIGAATGWLQPSVSTQDTLTNMAFGAGAAPLALLAGRGLAAGYGAVKGLVEPFFPAGRDRIAANVINQFAANPQAVQSATGAATATGARPTLAEATKDTGLATLERSLGQQDPKIAAAFGQRYADNNAARVAAVQGIAGDDAARVAAEAARQSAATPLYQKATAASVEVDKDLAELLARPSMQKAMARAANLAEEQGRTFGLSKPTTQPGSPILGPNGQPVSAATQTPGKVQGQTLQDLKMAMDDMLKDPTSGIVGKEARAVTDTRQALVNWMESKIPEFKAAREAWAKGTQPLNAMDVGDRLLEKTTAAMRDLSGNQKLQANNFARALNDEQTLVRKATGFDGFNDLSKVLTPQQLATLATVRSEMETAANLASAANGPGSQTAKSLASQNLLRRTIGPTGMPQSWAESALLQNIARPAQFVMNAAEPKIQSRVAELLLDPNQAAQMMLAYPGSQINGFLNPSVQRLLPGVTSGLLATQQN